VQPKLLAPVRVHESAIERIKLGHDHYAPTILPPSFVVVGPRQPPSSVIESPLALQSRREEWVFDDVWRRRVVYFLTVGVSLVLAAFPLIQHVIPPSACIGPQCDLTPVIKAVGTILPGAFKDWIDSFAKAPGWFLLTVAAILGLMRVGSVFKLRIQDGMRELWIQSYGLPVSASRVAPPLATATGAPTSWVYRLRTHPAYQGTLQKLKWKVLPDFFGAGLLFAALMFVAIRMAFAVR